MVLTDGGAAHLSSFCPLWTVRRIDGMAAGSSTSAILARTGMFLKDGNVAAAVTEMEQLEEAPATAAAPWLADATARVAAEQTVAEATNKALGALSAIPVQRLPAKPSPERPQ